MNHFLMVAQQVGVLFLLCAVGFFCNKAKILNDTANKCISNLVMLLVTPCVLIKSFLRGFNSALLGNFFLVMAASAAIHGLMIAVAHLLMKDNEEKRRRVYRFAVVFSNCGFMAIPLQQALLGEDGVFYGAAYLVVFNILLWTYGVFEMSGGGNHISLKKLVVNPGIIGVAVGLVLFFTSLTLPDILLEPLTHMANLNTPLPMIVVGYYFADSNFLEMLRDKRSYFCFALLLVILPLLVLGLLYAAGMRGSMLSACVIATSAPVGATTTMFASRFGTDVDLSANLVSFSTLLSIVTMPLIVGLTQMLA